MTKSILLTLLLIFPLQVSAYEIDQTHSEPYVHGDNTLSAQSWISKMKNWKAEQDRTPVEDMLNSALADLEIDYGSNGSTEQKVLLQFPGYGDNESP